MHDIGKEAIATQCCFVWFSVGLPLTVASRAFQPPALQKRQPAAKSLYATFLGPVPIQSQDGSGQPL